MLKPRFKWLKNDGTSRSLGANWFLPVSVGLLVFAIFILVTVSESSFKKDVKLSIASNMGQSLDVSESLLKKSTVDLEKDIRFLADSPAVIKSIGMQVDLSDAPTIAPSSFSVMHDVERTFAALMAQQEYISQLRILDANSGQELIRVQRNHTGVRVVPQAQLQNKEGREYSLETAAKKAGQVYISSIDLNRENGRVELPIKPTIRLGMPLFDAHGSLVSLLVMNVDAWFIMNELVASVDPRFQVYLLNENNQFLIHPNDNLNFAHELGIKVDWNSEFTRVSSEDDFFQKVSPNTDKPSPFFYLSSTLSFKKDDNTTVFKLIVGATQELFVSETKLRRTNTYLFAFIISFILFCLLLFFDTYLKRKIALVHARSEYQAIVNATKDAIISMDATGAVTTWNLAAQQIFSMSEKQAINQNFDDLALLPNVEIMSYISRILAGEKIGNFEIDFASKYSQNFILEFSLTPIVAGQIIGVAVVIRDVSIQRASEQAILASNKKLEEQVSERTQELEIARNDALKASQIKTDFISNISHEMRTPLNGIVGALELLRLEQLTSGQETYLKMANTSIDNLNGLVNDVLDISKIEAGKLEFEEKPFDLIEQIEDVAETFAIKSEAKRLNFILDLSGIDYRFVLGDKNRLRQIINNLLSNAFKFTKTGYIKLIASSSIINQKINFSCAVEDTGVGIAKANQDKLFSVFTQESSAVSGEFGGSGLGLSITKKLVELMDGNVSFESEKGAGSTFTFIANFVPCPEKINLNGALSSIVFAVNIEHQDTRDSIAKQLVSLGGKVLGYKDGGIADVLISDVSDLALSGQVLKSTIDTSQYRLVFGLRWPTQYATQQSTDNLELIIKPFRQTDFLVRLQPYFPEIAVLAGYEKSNLVDINDLKVNAFVGYEDKNILVVDDNDINLEVVKGMFNGHVKTVFSAKDGMQALSLLEKSNKGNINIDLILMDCSMPIMDGFECTQAIRDGAAGENYKDVPIVAVTAGALSGEREKCMACGMNDFLTKPITKQRLLNHSALWLDRQTAR